MELLQGQFASPTGIRAEWGANRIIEVPAPAAGANWTLTVLGGFCWVPVSIRYRILPGAEAGERFPGIKVENGQGVVAGEMVQTNPYEESKSGFVSFVRGWSGVSGIKNGDSSTGLPTLALEEGWKLSSDINGIHPLDTMTNIVVWVEEFEVAFDHSPDKVRQAAHEIDRVERAFGNG